MSLTNEAAMPLGLKRVINDTFKCQICHSVPIKPPVIATKCCKNILGCQSCVNTWYSGIDSMTKTCPMCRAERGCVETMIPWGFQSLWRLSKSCAGMKGRAVKIRLHRSNSKKSSNNHYLINFALIANICYYLITLVTILKMQ